MERTGCTRLFRGGNGFVNRSVEHHDPPVGNSAKSHCHVDGEPTIDVEPHLNSACLILVEKLDGFSGFRRLCDYVVSSVVSIVTLLTT